MGSLIGDLSIAKALRSAFNLVEQKGGPETLATGEVQPVVDVLQAKLNANAPAPVPATPNAGLGQRGAFLYQRDISTLISGGADIVGTGVFGVGPTLATQINGVQAGYRFDGLELAIFLNAAGATAMNGKQLGLRVAMFGGGDPGNLDFDLIRLEAWDIVRTGKFNHYWTLFGWSNPDSGSTPNYGASTWEGGFQAGGFANDVTLYAEIKTIDGSAFPAGSTLLVSGCHRVSSNGSIPIKL